MKLYYLINLLFVSIPASIIAQNISFELDNQEYINLESDTKLKNDLENDWYYRFDTINFPIYFEYQNIPVKELAIEFSGTIYINNYCDLGESSDFQPFIQIFANRYDDRYWQIELSDSLESSISYGTRVENGENVFIIQWTNVFVDGENSDSNTYFNMQCKFNEHQQTIEYHIGPHNIKNYVSFEGDPSPVISLSHNINCDFLDNELPPADFAIVRGNPENPEYVPIYQYDDYFGLEKYPEEGTIYRFGGIATNNNELKSDLLEGPIYLNNSTFRFNNLEDSNIKVYDLNGRLIPYSQINNMDISINNKPGVYVISISNKDYISNYKVLVK